MRICLWGNAAIEATGVRGRRVQTRPGRTDAVGLECSAVECDEKDEKGVRRQGKASERKQWLRMLRLSLDQQKDGFACAKVDVGKSSM